MVRFAARGLTYAVGRVGGFDLAGRVPMLGWVAGAATLLLVAVVFVRQAMGRLVAPLALGGVVAATAMYVVIGLTRADLASDFATRSRYVYVAAFLLIPALGDLIASLATGRRLPRAGVAVLIALAVLSIGANILDLRAGRATFARNAGLTRAYLTVLAENPGRTWQDPLMPLGWPAPDRVAALVERYGSPLKDTLVSSNARPPTRAQLERALLGLSNGSFTVTPDESSPAEGTVVPAVLDSGQVVATPADACLSVTTDGADGWITVSVPDGGALIVHGPVDGATASLGRALPPAVSRAKSLPRPSPDDTWVIAVPDVAGDSPWQVRLDLPRPVTARLCGSAP